MVKTNKQKREKIIHLLLESMYQSAVYEPNPTTDRLEIKPMDFSTPWIPVNPLYPDFNKFPRFANASAITVTVNEGEMLYLPGNKPSRLKTVLKRHLTC